MVNLVTVPRATPAGTVSTGTSAQAPAVETLKLPFLSRGGTLSTASASGRGVTVIDGPRPRCAFAGGCAVAGSTLTPAATRLNTVATAHERIIGVVMSAPYWQSVIREK